MGNFDMGNIAGGKKKEKIESVKVKGDRILSLFHTGIQDVKELANVFNTVSTTLDKKRSTDAQNVERLRKAETEAQKEINRHNEEMQRIEQEWKRISNKEAERERKLSLIGEMRSKLEVEYDRYLALENEDFFSETVTSRLASLRKVIVELTKELNRA